MSQVPDGLCKPPSSCANRHVGKDMRSDCHFRMNERVGLRKTSDEKLMIRVLVSGHARKDKDVVCVHTTSSLQLGKEQDLGIVGPTAKSASGQHNFTDCELLC